MDSLKSATLTKADGSTADAATALQQKELVLYYFSAHWCPPCRRFTPMLAEFYKESHGDWLAVGFNSDLSEALNTKYKVEGIPTLVVVTKEGKLLTDEGDEQVSSMKPAEAVAAWKGMVEKA